MRLCFLAQTGASLWSIPNTSDPTELERTVKNFRRTLVAMAVGIVALVGFAGVASAQSAQVEYSSNVQANTAEVQAAQVTAADPGQAAAVVSAGTLPYTGNDSSLPLAEMGAGLLAAGGLMVVVVRRRQTNAA